MFKNYLILTIIVLLTITNTSKILIKYQSKLSNELRQGQIETEQDQIRIEKILESEWIS